MRARDAHEKSREVLLLFLGAALPFLLRALQSFGLGKVYKLCKKKAFDGQDPLQEAVLPTDKELVGSNKVMMDDLASVYAGSEGWDKAVVDLGWHKNTARAVGVLRLLFWHMMQPVMYCWVFFSFSDQINERMYHLGLVVMAREVTYVGLLACGLCRCPAFLLVNLEANDEVFYRWCCKAFYVLTPERTVTYMVVPPRPAAFIYTFLMVTDICGLFALLIGAGTGGFRGPPGVFPAPLAVGYGATAVACCVSIVGFVGVYLWAFVNICYCRRTARCLGFKLSS
jgi:hypothetical protein